MPRSTLISAYEAADILMSPTLSDGFGLAVTEAMAQGLPVITTDQAGYRGGLIAAFGTELRRGRFSLTF